MAKLKKSLKANLKFGTAENVRVLNVGHAVSGGAADEGGG
jgi:hypothetical protein